MGFLNASPLTVILKNDDGISAYKINHEKHVQRQQVSPNSLDKIRNTDLFLILNSRDIFIKKDNFSPSTRKERQAYIDTQEKILSSQAHFIASKHYPFTQSFTFVALPKESSLENLPQVSPKNVGFFPCIIESIVSKDLSSHHWSLVVTDHGKSGVRYTAFDRGQLSFSRLIQGDPLGHLGETQLIQEFDITTRYIHHLSPHTPIDIYVLNTEFHTAFRQRLREKDTLVVIHKPVEDSDETYLIKQILENPSLYKPWKSSTKSLKLFFKPMIFIVATLIMGIFGFKLYLAYQKTRFLSPKPINRPRHQSLITHYQTLANVLHPYGEQVATVRLREDAPITLTLKPFVPYKTLLKSLRKHYHVTVRPWKGHVNLDLKPLRTPL